MRMKSAAHPARSSPVRAAWGAVLSWCGELVLRLILLNCFLRKRLP